MRYEVTVYVNAGVSAQRDGIQFINPYAAYDVTADEWSVLPDENPHPPLNPAWEMVIEQDRAEAEALVREYGKALSEVRNAQNPAHRANAESRLKHIMETGQGMFEQIHAGRRAAFGPTGGGYSDFSNYRWQAGKQSGVVHSLRKIADYVEAAKESDDIETYGMEMPTTQTLIRRQAFSYWNSQ